MITACHSCRTSEEITALVAEIDAARTAHDLAALAVAEVKRKALVARCSTCKRGTEHDDIRIRHSPHNHDELTAATIHPHERTWATALPEEDEDELRRLFSTFTALHPLAIIAARHLARGGTSRTVAAAIENFAAAVRGYRNGMSRATIAAKFLAIGRKLPAAASVRQWQQGHGGRKPKDSQ